MLFFHFFLLPNILIFVSVCITIFFFLFPLSTTHKRSTKIFMYSAHCPTFLCRSVMCARRFAEEEERKKTRRTHHDSARRSAFISPTSRPMYPKWLYLPQIFFPYNIFCENSFSFIRHSQSRRESCDFVLFSNVKRQKKKKFFYISLVLHIKKKKRLYLI